MPKDQSTDQNGIQMQQRHGSADPEKLNPLTFRSESFCFSTRPEYDQGSCGWLDDAQGSYTRNRRMILRRGRSEATTTFDDEIDVSKGTANYAATTPSRFQPNLNSRPSSALSSSLPIHDITSKITTTANSRPKSGALHAVDHCIVKRGVGAVEVIESIHIGSIAKDEQGAVSVLVSTSESDEFHQGLFPPVPPPIPVQQAITTHFSAPPSSPTYNPYPSSLPIVPGTPTMIFSEFQRSQALAHRRRAMANTPAVTEYEADLTSKDREKQKRAIKDILKRKVRNDWVWEWPQTEEIATPMGENVGQASENRPMQNGSREIAGDGYGADSETDTTTATGGHYGHERWVERDEWESNDSVDGASELPIGYTNIEDPFTSSDTNAPGSDLETEAEKRKARRRKRLLQEMDYNDGMKCFTHRRNAWTGARHIRKPPKPAANSESNTLSKTTSRASIASNILSRITSRSSNTASSPKSPKTPTLPPRPSSPPRLSSPLQTQLPEDLNPNSPTSTHDFVHNWLTQIPTDLDILPPSTPMRKNINSKAYGHIYDKVVLQSQTPYCPINLRIVVESCVDGWKRDGEWPPKEEGVTRVETGASFARAESRVLPRTRSQKRRDREALEKGMKPGEVVNRGGLRQSIGRLVAGVAGRRKSGSVEAAGSGSGMKEVELSKNEETPG